MEGPALSSCAWSAWRMLPQMCRLRALLKALYGRPVPRPAQLLLEAGQVSWA